MIRKLINISLLKLILKNNKYQIKVIIRLLKRIFKIIMFFNNHQKKYKMIIYFLNIN